LVYSFRSVRVGRPSPEPVEMHYNLYVRILAVSDTPTRALDERFDAEHWREAGIELIVSCGDLSPEYLGFLADAFRVPLYYVRGNHDERWAERPAGEDLDGRVVEHKGIKLFGIQGSPWYNDGALQYGERAMAWKLAMLRPRIWLAGRVDVVVAHAAPRFCPQAYRLCPRPVGVGLTCPYWRDPAGARTCQDASDYPHRGFESFRAFILAHKPRLFLHGHRHQTYGLGKRELRIGETRVIDTYGHVVIDV